jgi:predicted N-acetyltransferase YhbS
MTDHITVRHSESQRDVDAILDLFEVVFGQRIDRSVWDWKHRWHPAGESFSLVAENARGHVIAHNSYMPWKMRVAGRELVACQGVDLMVHPDYRRLGLANELVTAGRREMIERGWHFVFGFPGHESYRILLQRPGSRGILRLPYLILPHRRLVAAVRNAPSTETTALRVEKSVSPAPPRGVRVREIHAFDETVNALDQQTRGDDGVMTVRDSEYLNWRFFSHPTRRYTVLSVENEQELQGYCAIRSCEIFDLQTVDESELAGCLIDQVIRHIREQGHAVVGASFSLGSPGHQLLKRFGFLDSRFHIATRPLRRRLPLTLFVNPSSPVKDTVSDSRNWILSMSDVDYL